ncbi:2-phosphosulfolactate phosphatase [Chengkuizengella axinellae]|uniref:Probable 2-phosphosulfolactate phosphatase n=1 Tax=Chengkuizengella axinellae TaxID=3064388 RepID=A0ABT9J243_9BACL|nr:2-phosphosulfolactate phosphatase [Chengkuizengella sp. 2205SS18-9]MDP5275677.1 2-phosphosulfolactate phosphatase [Chengkuizengella sp. 2205SS18-9]
MQIEIVPNVNEARSDNFINKTVIVIDVLRATSSIVTALENGSEGIIPVETVSEAKSFNIKNELLSGERYCKKITGFDLGNSPLEFLNHDMNGKRIIMTTSNGTRAIQKSHKAAHVIAGTILNASQCAKKAIELKRDIVLMCAGTQDKFSLEDGLCAGLIIHELNQLQEEEIQLSDFSSAMYLSFLQAKNELQKTILNCSNGKKLCKMGLKEDVIFCTKQNEYSVVPILRDNIMVSM